MLAEPIHQQPFYLGVVRSARNVGQQLAKRTIVPQQAGRRLKRFRQAGPCERIEQSRPGKIMLVPQQVAEIE